VVIGHEIERGLVHAEVVADVRCARRLDAGEGDLAHSACGAGFLPTASAMALSSIVSAAISSRTSACGPSHNATDGFGCTSIITASAPAATAARARGATSSRRPPECDGSTITGRCVSDFATGTADTSSVLRYDD